jgi:acyl-CoA dehydrogenase
MSTSSEISVEDFEAEVRSFLEANAPKKQAPEDEKFVWGDGDDSVAIFEEIDPEEERRNLAGAKRWRAARFDADLGWITGPREYGGRALTQAHERAYARLEAGYETPDMGFFGIGLGMVAPTILAHGTDVTKDAYLRAMHRGDLVGCQLFSEPGAGSDLASVETRAVRDGDEWVVSGQKVWTSGAQYSDLGEVICRTDPDQPKHRGLTAFVVDMHAPGVEVRPLRQMTGGASFNEVFFEDVRIPDDHRLGDVNDGWRVALTTLMNERASIGSGSGGMGSGVASIDRLAAMLRHFGRADDAVLRDELVRIWIGFQVGKLTGQRATDKIKAGQLPGPEMSIGKLALTHNLTALSEWASRVLGPRVTADTGEWGTYAWAEYILGTPGMRLGGGTDEVMRNIVGERVLGLPKDPGIDSTSPFRELKARAGS